VQVLINKQSFYTSGRPNCWIFRVLVIKCLITAKDTLITEIWVLIISHPQFSRPFQCSWGILGRLKLQREVKYQISMLEYTFNNVRTSCIILNVTCYGKQYMQVRFQWRRLVFWRQGREIIIAAPWQKLRTLKKITIINQIFFHLSQKLKIFWANEINFCYLKYSFCCALYSAAKAHPHHLRHPSQASASFNFSLI